MPGVGAAFVLKFLLVVHLLRVVSSSGTAPSWYSPSGADSKSISESTASGTSVYVAIATDAEGDVLTYSIASQTPGSPAFQVNSSSGQLDAPAGLDAETVSSFTIVFSVSDTTSNVDSPTLTINLNDENEFSPVFNATSYSATIYDTAMNGDVLLTVFASDDDVTASVTYSITAGDASSTFSIGSNSGVLTVATASNLNPSTTPSYTLTVEASDGTNTDTATASVTVLDDPCSPNPCQNSGTCSISGVSYTCNCQTGWIGATCSTDDPCLPEPCENSGTCSVSGTTYHCSCTSGFSGTNCTDTPSEDEGNSDDGLSTGAIVGICVAVFIVCVVTTTIVVFLFIKLSLFKARMKVDTKYDSSKGDHFKNSRGSLVKSDSVSPIKMKNLDIHALQIVEKPQNEKLSISHANVENG